MVELIIKRPGHPDITYEGDIILHFYEKENTYLGAYVGSTNTLYQGLIAPEIDIEEDEEEVEFW